MDWGALTRVDRLLHRIGLEAQRTPPFVGRRYRYRRDRHVAKAIGSELMASETWRADLAATYPEGDLASIFRETLGLHKWLHYIPIYEATLSDRRNQPLRFLEIGVDRGGSLQAWSRYFGPQAVIVGIDINPACSQSDDPANHRHVRIGKQQDAVFLTSVVREFGPFDVILDDGSHRPSHTNASFRHLFDEGLVAGGMYLVEDLQTNYLFGYRDARVSFVDLAKGLVDELHAPYQDDSGETAFLVGSADRRQSFEVPRVTKLLQSIEFHDSIVVIRKAKGERQPPVSVFTGEPIRQPSASGDG